MLNNFCLHVYALKSLFIAENCNAFFDSHSHSTLSCYFRSHRAGSQLKSVQNYFPWTVTHQDAPRFWVFFPDVPPSGAAMPSNRLCLFQNPCKQGSGTFYYLTWHSAIMEEPTTNQCQWLSPSSPPSSRDCTATSTCWCWSCSPPSSWDCTATTQRERDSIMSGKLFKRKPSPVLYLMYFSSATPVRMMSVRRKTHSGEMSRKEGLSDDV